MYGSNETIFGQLVRVGLGATLNNRSNRKKQMNKRIKMIVAGLAFLTIMSGCSTDADIVSENLSKDAENFNIVRRVVFVNGITDSYLLSIEGRCSIEDANNQLEVTCKTGKDEYKKHFLGLSDNVSYFVEQLDSASVSSSRYKVIFRPSEIIPDVDVK